MLVKDLIAICFEIKDFKSPSRVIREINRVVGEVNLLFEGNYDIKLAYDGTEGTPEQNSFELSNNILTLPSMVKSVFKIYVDGKLIDYVDFGVVKSKTEGSTTTECYCDYTRNKILFNYINDGASNTTKIEVEGEYSIIITANDATIKEKVETDSDVIDIPVIWESGLIAGVLTAIYNEEAYYSERLLAHYTRLYGIFLQKMQQVEDKRFDNKDQKRKYSYA